MSSSSKANGASKDSDGEQQAADFAAFCKAYAGWIRAGAVSLALFLVLALPFALRPPQDTLQAAEADTLIILSPHNETIRSELAAAFARFMQASEGRQIAIDWRDMGGTSEISKFIKASYQSSFNTYWRRILKKRWKGRRGSPGLAAIQITTPDNSPMDDSQSEVARREFLKSNTSIGADLFFGGGTLYFQEHAKYGHFQPSPVFQQEPSWFSDSIIPQAHSGEPLYDDEQRWVGCCLSSFGICYNEDWIRRLDIDPPSRWDDLGDPKYLDVLALADPTKSGSTTKAFEMLLQQQLAASFARVDRSAIDIETMENDALDEGWVNGLNLIQRISANARYFTDLASKIPFDVAQGNAAAGMSIDFYGRTANETVKKPDGTSRVSFVIPEAGTSVSSDPIALLRGAPRPELANKFIHFLLSPTGQRLWHYQVGLENGPEKKALRRMPIRKDAYLPAELAKSTDPESAPYEQSRDFVYRPEWTGPHSNVIRFIIQVMCLETHEELKEAWTALIEAGFPPRATSIFYDVQFVGYTSVTHELSPKLRTDDALAIQKRRRTLRENFRTNYLRAARLARQGQ